MQKKNLDELNKIYNDAEEASRELFAEMRSNLLLIAGEHYSKINARISNNLRQTNKPVANAEAKLRLVKNYTHKVHRVYTAAILARSPGTTVSPQRDTEIQDQKDAEMNQSVWLDTQNRHKIKAKIRDWASDFTGIGEVCTKVFWDTSAGRFLGYAQKMDENGMPMFEESDEIDPMTGMPALKPVDDEESPMFTGDFVFEPVYGFNLMREVGTEDMEDKERAWIIRKMVDTKLLKQKYPEEADKIQESAKRTYIVFDAAKGSYDKKTGETLLQEFYWPVSAMHPKGWFALKVDSVILEEGPLPLGIFPIVWAGFDKFSSTPRGRSIIKVVRPFQAEVNRASSSMATAQVTMGDDKIVYSSGAKMSPGALLPGVRGIAITGGTPPTILPGRSGAQYMEYVASEVQGLYDAVMLDEQKVTDKTGQLDPYALLYKSATQNEKYDIYVAKFSEFLVQVTELVLTIAKEYLPDDMLIPAVGTREIVNLAEFRKTTPNAYRIKVEEKADTLETLFGRQLTMQHILQYVGKDLDKKTIGKLIRNSPFANFEDSFEELTIDEDIAKNDMLALERGEEVHAAPQIDPAFMVKKLTFRQKKPDFRFLDPQIQMNYQNLVTEYQQILADQEAKIAAAKNEYIPVDGALVTCDFYVPDTQNPENQAKRAKLPQRALEWLMERLNEQGASIDKLEGMNAQALSDMAEMILQGKIAPGQGSPGAGMPIAG